MSLNEMHSYETPPNETPPKEINNQDKRVFFISALEVGALILVPLSLGIAAFFQFDQAAAFTLLVAFVALGILFLGYEKSRPALCQIMPAAVLGALAATGRIIFAPLPYFKPVSAICILAGVVFGRRCGFMVGALAALLSNFFFGQGPWTPWQMYAWGLVGYLSGIFAQTGMFKTLDRPRRAFLYSWGFLSALLYGFLLNGWTLVGFVHPINIENALLIFGAGLPFDIVHGIFTIIFLMLLFEPWKKKLLRIKYKYAL